MNTSFSIILIFWSAKIVTALSFFYKLMLAKSSSPKTVLSTSNTELAKVKNVCIQIPVYNEPTHMIQILDATLKIKWPSDKLSIQILDDSTDNTTQMITLYLSKLDKDVRANIKHITRKNRAGYKAGALNNGRQRSKADFFAIFDADFRPKKDFLYKVIPEMVGNSNIAACQVAWSYYNGDQSNLTKIQEILLNIHFHIEHFGRFNKGLAFNFNGTAGVWQAEALDKLGGWPCESVCEDLLLSYRAQLSGYKISFLDNYTSPSELPGNIAAYLVQQRRWALGSGQVARILSKRIVSSSQWSIKKRFDALLHLFAYGLSTIISLTFLILPFWLLVKFNLKESLLNNLNYLFYIQLIDGLVWLTLLVAILMLLASKRAHWGLNRSFLSRAIHGIGIIFFSPIFIFWVSGSFWRGLLISPKSDESQLIFNRTPKQKNWLAAELKDSVSWHLFIFYSCFCSFLAFKFSFYLVGFILISYAIFMTKLLLSEQYNISLFKKKSLTLYKGQ